MFMPGAPPRAGSSAQATPYKTYDFHVGDEGKLARPDFQTPQLAIDPLSRPPALMTTAATLEWVAFEWPAERTVRLRIRETALNFGV